MSNKICLHWNGFKESANILFENLREDNDFTDVTLACEDGNQIDAHKVIFFSFFFITVICFFTPQGDLGSIEPLFQDYPGKEQTPTPIDLYERGEFRKPGGPSWVSL